MQIRRWRERFVVDKRKRHNTVAEFWNVSIDSMQEVVILSNVILLPKQSPSKFQHVQLAKMDNRLLFERFTFLTSIARIGKSLKFSNKIRNNDCFVSSKDVTHLELNKLLIFTSQSHNYNLEHCHHTVHHDPSLSKTISAKLL
jgi:hypothetical protein